MFFCVFFIIFVEYDEVRNVPGAAAEVPVALQSAETEVDCGCVIFMCKGKFL